MGGQLYLGCVEAIDGDPSRAVAVLEEVVEQARELRLPRDVAFAMPFLSRAHELSGNLPGAVAVARRAVSELPAGASGDMVRASRVQLADAERGFGFRTGGPLDMRFDPTRGVPASELLATLDRIELSALFKRYGEEPQANRIANAIAAARATAPITTAEELVALIERVAPGSRGPGGRRRIHPATRDDPRRCSGHRRGSRRRAGASVSS